jgi:hypothetical protein
MNLMSSDEAAGRAGIRADRRGAVQAGGSSSDVTRPSRRTSTMRLTRAYPAKTDTHYMSHYM